MRYLTTEEVAQEMGVAANTVRRWINQRGLRWHDIGVPGRPRIRISETDLKAWVEGTDKKSA